jgi:elongation factor P
MLSITNLKTGTKITLDNDPWVVLSYSHSKMGRGGAVVKTKLKNLKSGSVIDKTFQGADKIEDADLSKKSATFLYCDEEKAYFMDAESYDQFEIEKNIVSDNLKYLVENSNVDILYFNNTPINIELPIKMNFKIQSAPPGVKGNSAGSVTKRAILETGAFVEVPLFIKEGDKIVVDTRDGSYVERAN